PRAARELVSAAWAPYEVVAAAADRAGCADLPAVREAQAAQRARERRLRVRRGREGLLAQRAAGGVRHRTDTARSSALKPAPTARANGKTNATTAAAVRQPRSLTIMKTFAMQGTNSVIVTAATSACTASSCPARASA